MSSKYKLVDRPQLVVQDHIITCPSTPKPSVPSLHSVSLIPPTLSLNFRSGTYTKRQPFKIGRVQEKKKNLDPRRDSNYEICTGYKFDGTIFVPQRPQNSNEYFLSIFFFAGARQLFKTQRFKIRGMRLFLYQDPLPWSLVHPTPVFLLWVSRGSC